MNSSFLPDADVIFCAARAGTQVLNIEQLKIARNALVLADVNAAQPQFGGVGINDDDKKHPVVVQLTTDIWECKSQDTIQDV